MQQIVKSVRTKVATKRATTASSSSSKGKRKPVAIKVQQQWTQEEASVLLPAGARILRDADNGRWRVWYGAGNAEDLWSKSRSWGIAGQESLKFVLVLQT